MIIAPVHHEIVVRAAPARAFDVFAKSDWWPADHTLLNEKRDRIVIEPRAGGRWYEVGAGGTECNWGKVLEREPPRRMVLAWQLNGNFKYDTSGRTEVEVNFVPEGDGTRVILEHRGFENYATGRALRDAVGSDEGWSGVLKSYTGVIAPAAAATVPASSTS